MKKRSTFDTIMIILIALIAGIIVIGTILTFTKKNKQSDSLNTGILQEYHEIAPEEKQLESLNKKSDEKIAAYTGLGTIRAVTLPSQSENFGTAVVITPWFSYPEGNTDFFEELSKKRLLLIGIFTNYFSTKTLKELQSLGEDYIKAELLKSINDELSLGKVSNLYFTNYIFLN